MEFVKFRATHLTVDRLVQLYKLVNEKECQMMVWATETSNEHDDGTTPIPWDTSIEIVRDSEGVNQLQLEGGAGPCGIGHVLVRLPLESAGHYAISLDNFKDCPLPDWLIALHDRTLKH